jgi:hypothetical protein
MENVPQRRRVVSQNQTVIKSKREGMKNKGSFPVLVWCQLLNILAGLGIG